MKQDPNELLKEALKLPPEARAALAGSLLDSLDQEVDEDKEAAWHAEIDRRLRYGGQVLFLVIDDLF